MEHGWVIQIVFVRNLTKRYKPKKAHSHCFKSVSQTHNVVRWS